jgi:hypothetical protein
VQFFNGKQTGKVPDPFIGSRAAIGKSGGINLNREEGIHEEEVYYNGCGGDCRI